MLLLVFGYYINNAAVDIQVLMWTYVFISLGYITMAGLGESSGKCICSFIWVMWEMYVKCFKVAVIFSFSPALHEDSPFPHSCPSLIPPIFLALL